MRTYALVIVDINSEQVDRRFTYAVPAGMDLAVGERVTVPFGPRRLPGVVMELTQETDVPAEKLRPILARVDDEPVVLPELMDLARWLAAEYRCTMAAALRCILPAQVRANLKPLTRLAVRLTAAQEDALARCKRSERQRELIARLAESPEGVRLADLARALDAGARLVYLIPTYHNPTGRNMSLQRRQEVLALCRARGVPLLEDGFNEELRFRGECHPAIKALAGSEDVIYAGSFSKVLFPGLRVGWVAAPAALTRYLVHEKYNQDIHTPPLLQAALRQYCLDGSLDRHIKRVRGLYRERLDALYDALERRFSGRARWEKVEGGFSAWLEFPEGIDLREGLAGARDRGVLYAPGDAFYPDGRGRSCMRLGFSRLEPGQIARGIDILSDYINSLGG